MSAKPCNGKTCRKLVVFARDKDTGKWQVLNNQAPMWRVCGRDADGTPLVERVHDTLLSHFVNCSDAKDFSAEKTRDFTEAEGAD